MLQPENIISGVCISDVSRIQNPVRINLTPGTAVETMITDWREIIVTEYKSWWINRRICWINRFTGVNQNECWSLDPNELAIEEPVQGTWSNRDEALLIRLQ